jgi:plasmid stabilization system protein ParE
MRLVFSPEARVELEEAGAFYNRRQPGLGKRLNDEVRKGLVRIRTWPLSCPIERNEIRRLVIARFPYKILYSVETDHLYIIAVAHQHRAPGYWADRAPPDA